MKLSYDATTKMFTVSRNNRVLDADKDGGVIAHRYGFIKEVGTGSQPELTTDDYLEYASYSYSYVKPASAPGMENFLLCAEEPQEYCW